MYKVGIQSYCFCLLHAIKLFFLPNFSSSLYSLFPFTSSSHPVIWLLLSLLSWNCMWSEMAYFLLFFFSFSGLRLCLTFLLCDTVDESLSVIEIFFFLAVGTVCSCFSHIFLLFFCPPNWLFFCVHVFRHPPGSSLLS